ncbi:hypothetical protein EDB84DRAFT_129567 [Lactarius hengduanensis]|nr:hypothetical protein EDB84DRAFT_129567 [Lactarius hengduanensis]
MGFSKSILQGWPAGRHRGGVSHRRHVDRPLQRRALCQFFPHFTFGLRPRSIVPASPTKGTPSRRNSHRASWGSTTSRRRRVDSSVTLNAIRGEKRLVVSGLEEGNLDAELAVKRWCESFGEIRRISRKDGALHVSWKKASVADTVSCIDFDSWRVLTLKRT